MRGKPKKRRLSVALKLGLSLLAVTIAASVALGIQEARQARSRVIQNYVTQAQAISTETLTQYQSALSASSKMVDVESTMQGHLADILMNNPGLYRVRLFGSNPPATWMSSNPLDTSYKPTHSEMVHSGVVTRYTTIDGQKLLEVAVPRWMPPPANVSSMSLYYSLDAIVQAQRTAVKNAAIGAGIVLAVELLVLFPIFELVVLRRVRRLGKAAAVVASGDYSVHLPEGEERPGRDEVANVAREFDSMVRTIEKKTRQQEAVARLGQHALEGLSLSDLFQEASALVAENLGVEYAAVMECLEDDLLVMRVGVGWEGEPDGAPFGQAERSPQGDFTLRNLTPVVVNDFARETRFQRSELQIAREVVSSVSVVIPGQSRPFGVLAADSQSTHAFTDDEVTFMEFVASVLAGWIERRQAEEQVTFMAYHDKLTGLPNRAMLEEHLHLALARAERGDLGVAVLFMDMDNFKIVNDTMGHAAGDELLRQMAGRLREATREVDLVARQGGDEFLVLLADLDKGTSDAGAGARDRVEDVAVSIARRVEELLTPPFEVGDKEFSCSASIGISLYPFDATDVSNLLKYADTAMYQSKASGHGLFTVHGEDVPRR
jgi:diguanylate cyclase (GGDEF)-like protein